MTTYSVSRDEDNILTLWDEDARDDGTPVAISALTTGGDTLAGEDHGVVFRAAAAVLAPDEAAVEAVARAIHEERGVTWCRIPWRDVDTDCPHGHGEIARQEERAVLAALRAHVEEATP